ncbi:MAG TPA: hypothetical protein VHH91_01045, partial [Vicinamibacterales bacterium]|nr:hypothetical protein [Vicinamibacterales bacterium]
AYAAIERPTRLETAKASSLANSRRFMMLTSVTPDVSRSPGDAMPEMPEPSRAALWVQTTVHF